MDDLERYVDVLFADYRGWETANAFRISMLNDLLLEKEKLRVAGKSEAEATQIVLASLSELSAPTEGDRLIFMDRYRREEAASLVLWLLAAVVLSVPLLVLGNVLPTAAALLAAVIGAARFFRVYNYTEDQAVEFVNVEGDLGRRWWIIWAVCSALWLAGAWAFTHSGFSFAQPVEAVGALGKALTLARYYPPLLLLPLPLWAAGRQSLLLKNEVGAGEDGLVERP